MNTTKIGHVFTVRSFDFGREYSLSDAMIASPQQGATAGVTRDIFLRYFVHLHRIWL